MRRARQSFTARRMGRSALSVERHFVDECQLLSGNGIAFRCYPQQRQSLGPVRAVLTGSVGDERDFHQRAVDVTDFNSLPQPLPTARQIARTMRAREIEYRQLHQRIDISTVAGTHEKRDAFVYAFLREEPVRFVDG